MNILFIIGSFRESSFNKQLAKKTQELIGERAQVSYLSYDNLPFMNQDLEKNPPEEVIKARETVKAADGIWFFTAQYNGFLPGLLKNLLDWLSRPNVPGDYASGTAIEGKKATASGVGGKSYTKGARSQLDTLLKMMKVKVMSDPEYGFAVPPESFKTDVWIIPQEDIDKINAQIDDFLKFLKE